MIRAILFDLDNTLYPHRQYVEGAFRGMAELIARRCDATPQTVWDALMHTWDDYYTRRRRQFYLDILAPYGLAGERNVQALRQIYHRHTPTLTPFDGAGELLATLAADLRLGLLTDGWAPTQRRKLAALGLDRHFHTIVCTGDLGQQYYKPNPRGYRMALDRLETDPQHAVFVGDNPETDIRGARKLGLWTVRIRHGEYRRVPDAADAPAHRTCRELRQLARLLADLRHQAG